MPFPASNSNSLTGTPISGALLTSNYTWWIPAVFSGVSWLWLLFFPEFTSTRQQVVSVTGGIMYTVMRFIFVRRQIKEKHNAQLEIIDIVSWFLKELWFNLCTYISLRCSTPSWSMVFTWMLVSSGELWRMMFVQALRPHLDRHVWRKACALWMVPLDRVDVGSPQSFSPDTYVSFSCAMLPMARCRISASRVDHASPSTCSRGAKM